MDEKPSLWIFSGANGSGKSTLISKIGLDQTDALINPDIIAANISPEDKNNPNIVIQAGNKALSLRKNKLANKQSFAIETTLSGHSTLKLIKEAKECGYHIHLVFIGLENHQLSNACVATRVKCNGHDVSEHAIIRRYPQTFQNLLKTSLMIERLYVFDNSTDKHILLLHMNGSELKYLKDDKPRWAKSLLPELISMRIQNIYNT